MKFKVYSEVFEKIPDLCFGAVAAYNIDNKGVNEDIYELLENEMEVLREKLEGCNLKEYKQIIPYREAFVSLNINPNKFRSSIEAMSKRIQGGSKLPSINPVVDLVNVISLKYVLPLGAHDMDALEDEISVRFAVKGDNFIPLGTEDIEEVDTGELIYADTKRVRTRRWIWRQSEIGKITGSSKNIFFPIDGFSSKNKENVVAASQELSELLNKYFDCKTKVFFINRDLNEVEL